MKKTTEVMREPEYTWEATTWTCEVPGCDFETTDEEQANVHPGFHAIKEERYVAGYTIYRFESDKDLKDRYVYETESRQYDRDVSVGEPDYAGPGWYYEDTFPVGCRCGGCGFTGYRLTPVATLLKKWAEEKVKLEQKTAEITTLINPQEN